MLPSLKHFMNFIDVLPEFENHGFNIKKGGTFKFNSKPSGYETLFRYAEKCGCQTFDGVKVTSLGFRATESSAASNADFPESASWTRRDKSAGRIRFKYLVDASGRAGLMSTKYLKNRRYNEGLKNLATWGYFEKAATYGVGTVIEGSPYFSCLEDASGWIWAIPLHNGTTSVGVVRHQNSVKAKKQAMGALSTKDYFLGCLHEAPGIMDLIQDAELVSEIKSASDWSYNASSYAATNVRIVGDAGCFIDPLFSSGVHLALLGALSVAATICASMKGQCSERAAGEWHSKKIREAYTRFLLVVSSAYGQMAHKDRPVLNELNEGSFDRAFDIFRPIIQGTVDANGKIAEKEVKESIEFCVRVLRKIDHEQSDVDIGSIRAGLIFQQNEVENMKHIIMNSNETFTLDSFGADVIDGMTANIIRGSLGLEIVGEPCSHRAPLTCTSP
ncbi:NAD(P)/FAD-dependent oxidoreductase [Aspergillus vadensis CBS 113365]|uniref:CrpH protein n=1 Tax=Aspergillus vadensis (strain CBS 113365 / IMI 142717 / IBT 24658) TaxID=1448311 RepID=A0A319CDM4_ASPVC|nr:CrpH protein [Aspergillus vadensis CBS 113365]PYH73428.1 CrpH protein [Aspergillus vadensis CBS 113365]